MQWIDRFVRFEGELMPVYMDKNGRSQIAQLGEMGRRLTKTGRKLGVVERLDLRQLKRTDSQPYREAVGIIGIPLSGHDVYSMEHEGKTLYIPAGALLTALWSSPSSFTDWILSPTGLDRLVVARAVGDGVDINVTKAGVPRVAAKSRHIAERLRWFTCFPSGRRTWSSVYKAAREGCLSVAPPNALITAMMSGFQRGVMMFVTNIQIKTLSPTEEPLPFATALSKRDLDFSKTTQGHIQNLSAYKAASPQHPSVKGRFDIPDAAGRWSTDDREWHAACRALTAAGFIVKPSTKLSVDTALEKLGGRKSWPDMGENSKRGFDTYNRWRSQGKWGVLVATLKELRTTAA